MNEDDIKSLLWHKELALIDFGSAKIVKPTGRYIDSLNGEKDDMYIPNRRWLVEIKNDYFSKRWVNACQLKSIQSLKTK